MNESTFRALLISFGLFVIVFAILLKDQVSLNTATLFALIIALVGFEIKQNYEVGYVKAKVEELGHEVDEIVNEVFKRKAF